MPNLVRIPLVWVTFAAALFVSAVPAGAFDLFGYTIDGDGIRRQAEDGPVVAVEGQVRYAVTIQVDQSDLEPVIENISVLVSDQGEAVADTIGLLTRARVDQKRIVAALYGEAYYGAVLDILVNGTPIDDVPLERDLSGTVANVLIKVEAGPEFLFAEPRGLVNGKRIDLSPYGVISGTVAKSDLILDAQNSILSNWREQGYAFVAVDNRTIEADHSNNRLDVVLEISTGPIAKIGAVRIEGAETVNENTILEVADFPAGAIYNPTDIKRSTRQLQALGVFNSVVIKAEEDQAPGERVDLVIEVSERKPRTIGVGATIGNFDGLGIEGFWVHRNLFGGAEKLRVEGSVGRIGQGDINQMDFHTALVFFKPNAFGPKTSFEGKISFDIENSNAFVKRGGKVETNLTHQITDELSVKGGLAAEYAVVTDENVTTNTSIISAPFELTYDSRDNKLDPTEGYFATIFAEPTYAIGSQKTFIKTSASVATYYSFDDADKFVLAGRVAAGSVFGADINDVPVDRRFFAGGAGSIRGYAYQAAGPLSVGGNPTGGMSFLEASIEGRYKVTDQIGVVGFMDTGGAYASNIPGQNGDFYTGVGVGVRYLTPLGPIRADIAIPLKNIPGQPKYGLYLGIGQAF